MFLELTLVGYWNMWLKMIFLSQNIFYRNIVCQNVSCEQGLTNRHTHIHTIFLSPSLSHTHTDTHTRKRRNFVRGTWGFGYKLNYNLKTLGTKKSHNFPRKFIWPGKPIRRRIVTDRDENKMNLSKKNVWF